MKPKIVILTSAILMAVAFSTTGAQVESPALTPDVTVLEGLCEQNTYNDSESRLCLRIVHSFLIPGSGPVLAEAEFGLGDTQDRDGLLITPLKVRWNVGPNSRATKPGSRMQFVVVLVRYEAGGDTATYRDTDWEASDEEGFVYRSTRQTEPSLRSGNIRPGRVAQGWITFRVPRRATWLEVSQTGLLQSSIFWTIERSVARPPR